MILESISKINKLVTTKQKYKLVLLSVLLIIGMFLEALGIAILVPFLQIISNQEGIDSLPYLDNLELFFSFSNRIELINLFLFLLLVIYTIKTIFLIFLHHRQNIFLNNINAQITSKLFILYITQPYSYFSKINTADLFKRLSNDTSYFNVYCSSLLSIISETGLFFSILLSIVIIDPYGATSIGALLLILSYIYYYFTKFKMKKWGENRKNLEEKISNITVESLKGIKELIVYQKTSLFGKIFEETKTKLSDVQANFKTLSIVPRYYIELISVFALISFIFLMISLGKNLTTIIPTLGVFLAATIKMAPSVNKMITAFQNLKYYGSSINILVEDFKLPNIINQNSNSFLRRSKSFKKISIKNLNFKYQNSKKNTLNNINIEIQKGTTIGIIGKSGEGKSTLIDLLVGLYKPTSGKVLLDNEESIYNEIDNWRSCIGYVSQNLFLFDSTIAGNIAFGEPPSKIDNIRLEKSIRQANLVDLINNLPEGTNTKVGEGGIRFSGGQKQRIAIARALYNNPDILILDEATSSLDLKTEREIMKSINLLKEEKTIIIIAHRLSTLKNCDKIFEIKNSKLNQIKSINK